MQKRHIRIIGSLPYSESTDWDERLRRTFGALGWTVSSYGPTQSATHPEEDYLELESESGTMELATLKKVLDDLSIRAYESGFNGDINGLKAGWSIEPIRAERSRYLRENSSSLPEIVPEKGMPTRYTKVTLNGRKDSFDGLRFTTPDGDRVWNLDWEFVAPYGAVKDWDILLWSWGGVAFGCPRRWLDYQEEGADLPKRNLRVVQSLHDGRLQSATEYLIWFTFHNAEPVEMHVRLGLTEAGQTEKGMS
jgi:hypothetical protein